MKVKPPQNFEENNHESVTDFTSQYDKLDKELEEIETTEDSEIESQYDKLDEEINPSFEELKDSVSINDKPMSNEEEKLEVKEEIELPVQETSVLPEYEEPDITVEDSVSINDEVFVQSDKPMSNDDGEDKEELSFKNKPVIVNVQFPKNATTVECILSATGYKDKVIAAGKQLRLLQNRLYFIPVNTEINSDEYSNIKIMSDISESIDVRYVKNGYACVMPIKHNVKIRDTNRLAILS